MAIKKNAITAALFMSSADFAVDLIETARASLGTKDCHKTSSLLSQLNEQLGQARGIALQMLAEAQTTSSKRRKTQLMRDLKLIRSDMALLVDQRKQLFEDFDAECSCNYQPRRNEHEQEEDFEVPEDATIHGLEGAVKVCARYERGPSGKLRCKQWSSGPGYAEGPHVRRDYYSQKARDSAGIKRKYRYRKSLPYNPRPGEDPSDVPITPSNIALAKNTQKRFSSLSTSVKSDIVKLVSHQPVAPRYKGSKLKKLKGKTAALPPQPLLLLPPPDDTSGEE